MKNEYLSNFAAIVESSEDAIINRSLDGIIRTWNKGSEKMFGYESKEMIGKNISLIIPSAFKHDDKLNIRRLSHNEIVDRYETIRIKKNGEQIYVSLIVSDIIDHKGNIIGVCQVARDITSRKKSEAELIIANKELVFQNEEKEKRASELLVANIELAFQNKEKEKRASELLVANIELAFQNDEKHKRVEELQIASKELAYLNKEQQALFASIVNSSHDAMLSINLDGIIQSWNNGAEKTFGYNASEVIGKKLLTLVPLQLLKEEVDIMEKIKIGKTVELYETERLKKDGTVFNASLTISPIKNFEGNIIGASTVLRDITEKRKAAEEKRRLTNRLLLATKSANIGIWDWDIINNTMVWDEGMYKLYNLTSANFNSLYEGWSSRLFAEDRERVDNDILLAIDNKKDFHNEFRIVWDDTTIHDINATGIVERDKNGIPLRMIGANWDVTSQKEKERHLKLLESVITNTTDAVLITEAEPFNNPNKKIVYVNEAFTKMTGYGSEEVIGKSYSILLGPKTDRIELERMYKAIINWHSFESSMINYKKNGEKFWNKILLIPVANEKGWYTHFIAIECDVTKQKLKEIKIQGLYKNIQIQAHKLTLSNSELEQFAYVASHDLQEPLRMITGFLNLLEKKYGDVIDDKAKKYISFAVDGSNRMRQIIVDLLELSRVGRIEENKEELNLNELVHEVTILLRKSIDEKNAVITVDALPQITSCRALILQVFQNLLANALKYSKKNIPVKIHIAVSEVNEYWQFIVTDNGIGIDNKYFDKIFIMFQRLHNKNEYSGTGIGLAITKKIIETQGGKIWVVSEKDKGSSFIFTLKK